MKQLSNLRNIAAVFAAVAVAVLAMFALSPKAYAATEIIFYDSTGNEFKTTNPPPGDFPYPMQHGIEWTDANTLTLNNYNDLGDEKAISIIGDITIVVNGTNSITDPDSGGRALYVNGNLTFTGNGTLTVNGYDATVAKHEYGSTAISCTGTVTIDGPTINANGGDSSSGGVGGASGIYLPNGSLNILNGTIATTGGNGIGIGGGGGNGVTAPNGSVIISGGASVTMTGGNSSPSLGSGGNGVVGNVEIHTTTTTVTIRGNLDKANDLGGHGVSGNLTTPTGAIGPGTNITIIGGEGNTENGSQHGGSHFSLPNPQKPTQQQKPAMDVIYPTSQTGTTRGVYTFSSSGLYIDFSGVWIHGFAIPASYYTATRNADGTVSITLADWYVRTLNYNEEYLLHFVFNSGYGVTKFYR